MNTTTLEDPQKCIDRATTMAIDASRLCLGEEPNNHTLIDVVKWMSIVWHVDVREYLNREAAPAASPLSPHDYQPHKKYPWFCDECGYAPHDMVKHKPSPEWTPQTRYCANCDGILSYDDVKHCKQCLS